jgi:hypothetical protein
MDETGHSKDEKQRFVGIAGLLAPAQNWETFESKWKSALKLPYIDLPYFHMTDFAARKKAYKNWSEEKRRAVLSKLFTVIETAHPLPFGAIVPLELYRSLKDEHKEYFVDPYFLCFQSCVAACVTFLEDLHGVSPEEKVALIFSDQVEFRHRALQIYEQAQEDLDVIKRRGTPPVFRDMRKMVALQAADIIAYEMYKEYERRTHRPNASPRYGYERLVKMTQRNYFPEPMFMIEDEKSFAELIVIYEKNKEEIEWLEELKGVFLNDNEEED